MSNVDLIQRHLNNVGKPAEAQDLEAYAENVVFEFPYAPEGHTRRLDGREAVSRFLTAIGTFAEGVRVGGLSVIESGDTIVAEYHADATFKESGRPYAQDYVAIVKIQNGQIAQFREHYDPLRVLRAMGEID